MNLLVPLAFRIDPLCHGRNLRIVHLLRELSSRCNLVCAAADDAIARGAAALLPEAEIITAPTDPDPQDARAATLRGPWLLRRTADFFGYDPAFHAWLDRLSGRADAALGFDLPSAMYLDQLGEFAGRELPTICDVIDDPWLTCRSEDALHRWSGTGLKTAVAVQVFRRLLLPRMGRIVAVATRDADSLARAIRRRVQVVPNGVRIPAHANASCREALIVFTGGMSFPPNEQAACWLAHAIWPHVLAEVPHARLAIVGADPGPRVRALAGLANVTVTGRVDDIGTWLRRASAAAAPMLTGTGMKNKILEACANACPVVATSLGVGDMPSGEADGIIVTDQPVIFARELARLVKDPGLVARIGEAGVDMVRERFTWSRSADALWTMIRDCMGSDRKAQRSLIRTRASASKEELVHGVS